MTPLAAIAPPFAAALIGGVLRGRGGYAVVAGSALAAVAAIQMLGSGARWSVPWVPGIGAELSFRVDAVSGLMGVLVASLVLAIAVYSVAYMRGDYRPGWYWFWLGVFEASMLTIVYGDNLWTIFLGWEGVGLASWALIGHRYRDDEEYWVGDGARAAGLTWLWRPSEAAVRAAMFVRVGDAAFLLGVAAMVAAGYSSVTAGPEAAAKVPALALALFLLGPLSKSAIQPFTEWLLTAMTGPASVSALIHAATMVKAGVFLLLVTAPAFAASPAAEPYFTAVTVLGLATAVTMAIVALASTEYKIVLAASTAENLGLIAASVGVAGLAMVHGEEHVAALGLAAAMAHIVGHAVAKASLFMGWGAVIHETHSRFVGRRVVGMRATEASMLISALSLAGVPPLLGYFTHAMVDEALRWAGYTALVAAVVALLTPIYMLRLWALTFRVGEEKHVHEAPTLMVAPYAALAAASVALGLAWPVVGGAIAEAFHLGETTMLELKTLAMVAVGLAVAAATYLVGRVPRIPRALWEVAYRRLYAPVLFDAALGRGLDSAARALYRFVDVGVVDAVLHGALPKAAASLSVGLRRLATGSLAAYFAAVAVAIGVLVLAVLAG